MSVDSLAAAEWLFISGNLWLAGKIVTSPQFDIEKRVSAVFVVTLVCFFVSFVEFFWVEGKRIPNNALQRPASMLPPMVRSYVISLPPSASEPADSNKIPSAAKKLVPPASGNKGPNRIGRIPPRIAKAATFPTIVVKHVEIPNIEAGKDPSLKVDIQVKNSDVAIKVKSYKATGIKPYHKDDVIAQQKEENDLWDWFMGQTTLQDATKFQIPVNNEAISLNSVPNVLSQENFDLIKPDINRVYYLFYVVDDKGRDVLEFCGLVGIGGTFQYCSFHNGP